VADSMEPVLIEMTDPKELAVVLASWADYAAGGFTGPEEYREFKAFLAHCQELPWWQEVIDRLKARGDWNFG